MPTLSSSSYPHRAQKALGLTGAGVLALCAVFAVLAVLIPVVRIGFIPAAVATGAVGVGLILLSRRVAGRVASAQHILESGTPAKATIVTMAQTALMVNLSPQVRMTLSIEIAGRPAYQVELKVIVPLLMVGRLSSGAPLAVKVDPSDAAHVVIDWNASMPDQRS